MNKKGFTLIELLSSIAIMGLIATIASINIVKIFDNKKTLSENNKNNIIETAACVYIELKENADLKETCLASHCEITTDTLIKEGLLDNEEVNEEKIIEIYKENNEKVCKIKGE